MIQQDGQPPQFTEKGERANGTDVPRRAMLESSELLVVARFPISDSAEFASGPIISDINFATLFGALHGAEEPTITVLACGGWYAVSDAAVSRFSVIP